MVIHTVKQDESIYKIAKQYHTSSDKIIRDNGLTEPEQLVVGQSLIILESPYLMVPDDIVRASPDKENREIIVNGYTYPFDVFLEGLDEALPYLTYLSIFSYETREDGSLVPIDDQAFIKKAWEYHAAPRMVVANISEEGVFDGDLAHEVLKSQESQNALTASVFKVLEGRDYDGVDLDFENLHPDEKDNYNYYLEQLSAELRRENYTLSAAIEKKTGADVRIYAAHDYEAHGAYDDLVILMTYDWGYLFGPPMAISPADEVEKVLQYAVTEMPPEKILMGIPNYAFDWTLPYEEGTAAAPMSHVDAVQLAWEKGAEIQYDEKAQSPYFHYYDEDGKEHEVWFEDARSIYAKMQLVDKYSLGGVSYWTVNKSFPQNWTVLNAMYDVVKVEHFQG